MPEAPKRRGGKRPGAGAPKGRSGGKRAGAGSPFTPTQEQRELVAQLVAVGLRHEDIRQFIKTKNGTPICKNTLLKHFAEELATGAMHAHAEIARTLYQKARKGDTASMIFWLKCRAGWSTTQRVEMTGPDGGPIQSVSMTGAEFRQIAREIAGEV